MGVTVPFRHRAAIIAVAATRPTQNGMIWTGSGTKGNAQGVSLGQQVLNCLSEVLARFVSTLRGCVVFFKIKGNICIEIIFL